MESHAEKRSQEREGARARDWEKKGRKGTKTERKIWFYKWNVNDVWKNSQTNVDIMVYSYAYSVSDKKRKVANKKQTSTITREEVRKTEREDKEMPLMKMVYR